MTAVWIAACVAVFLAGYWFGYLAGRDQAERIAERTIADLRVALRRVARIDHADERRPE